jgi:uncharacterized membrane protein
MEQRDKYDTNPLDPEFVRQTDEIRGGHATREVARTPQEEARRHEDAEAPTQRIDTPQPSVSYNKTNSAYAPRSYPSSAPFIAPSYQPPRASFIDSNRTAHMPPAGRRVVTGLGLSEKVASILPYLPSFIGLVAAVIELFLVPRKEVRTRFHAAQGLSLQLAILIISFLFRLVGMFSDSHVGGRLFAAAAFIFLIISMVRVWKGKEHRLMPLADLTRFFNERIEPRKLG